MKYAVRVTKLHFLVAMEVIEMSRMRVVDGHKTLDLEPQYNGRMGGLIVRDIHGTPAPRLEGSVEAFSLGTFPEDFPGDPRDI
jgi:hypothetical protein